MTHRFGMLVGLSVALVTMPLSDVHLGAATPPQVYRLTEQSWYQTGCFAPGACAPVCTLLSTQIPVRGTFTLTPTGSDGSFDTFAVSEVNWTTTRIDGPPIEITGSGTYRVGSEGAPQQQLQLDLDGDGAPVEHFESGLAASGDVHFPAIHSAVSITHTPCSDTVVLVDAVPVQPCVGDCDGDSLVTIDELITGVNIALGIGSPHGCLAISCNGAALPSIDCLILALNNALYSCHPPPPPTPTENPCGEVCDGRSCGEAQCPGGLTGSRFCTVPRTGSCECSPVECPTLPPTSPTPTRPPITYRLTDGSTILFFTTPTPGSAPPVPEPLSGTFVMHVTCSGPPPTCYFPSPNTLFHATISAISFQSPRFTVTGEGYIDVTTLNQPPEAYLFANLTIDGVTPFGLNGGGPFDTVNDPPHFDDLKGSTGPYQLTLFAIPDE